MNDLSKQQLDMLIHCVNQLASQLLSKPLQEFDELKYLKLELLWVMTNIIAQGPDEIIMDLFESKPDDSCQANHSTSF